MKLAVFASGGGSNFQAIADASRSGLLNADVRLCVTDNAEAGVLNRAQALDITASVTSAEQSPRELLQHLHQHDITHIALAGYLRMVAPEIIDAFEHKIVNIHPALLPSFGGKGMYGQFVHQAVIESGVYWSGVTIHFVDQTYDTGPIIFQHPVGVAPDDTATSLSERVLSFEHQIYPAVLQLIAEGRVEVAGGRARIEGMPPTFDITHPSFSS